ncbi:MAG: hypothetical protein E5V49_01430 [Mesorhizobium sp.]|nr:hypothetical protein EN795_11495 [bacterium M00.F.Ca.ET.152.01.1.1]TGV37318.1 hypothetical protein EN829_011520 [Mesorhizobium sp. M00.F.Ca.ET.186.01.1.1]TIW61422.1 MAG: hypothetical protein E5V48_09275 [Mesorhizobium sp.]TJW34744.1 MAG: hypothetical protein E5V49_01430 [Mesorhizobium sp.]
MLLMASLRVKSDSLAGEYVLPKHKPKGRGPVNTLHRMLRCGISVSKPVDCKDLPIEQTM